MKAQFSLGLFRLALACTWAVALMTGTAASARPARVKPQSLRLPTMVVEARSLTAPDLIPDETIATPDDTVTVSRLRHPDGSITMPDGSLLVLAKSANSDGTVLLPDGSLATRQTDGTLTLENGTVVDATVQPADSDEPAK